MSQMLRVSAVYMSTFAAMLLCGCLENLSEYEFRGCLAETDEELCASESASCGTVAAVDSCDRERAVDCGSCPDPDTCGGGGEANQCGCDALSDSQYCDIAGAECGTVSGVDPCGTPRAVACGKCAGTGETCVGNKCACDALPDEELCMAHGLQCGSTTVTDACDTDRTIACGSCDEGLQCADNVCVCAPEDDAEACARLGLDCGTVPEVVDNCGDTRLDVRCGPTDCSAVGVGLTCGGGGTEYACGCAASPDSELCAMFECGRPQITDDCGNTREINCGGCDAPQTCGGGPADDDNFVCGCTAESSEAFCDRKGYECGVVANGFDNCGNPVSDIDCGDCDGDEECGAQTQFVCTCVAETAAEFCADRGATCGQVSGMDRCGTAISANCGTCPAGEQCDANSNHCVCAPETDAQFCSRLNACGPTSAKDNCGVERTVTCPGCPNGSCISGTCSNCTPESNQQFCARLGANCGSVTGDDNCGVERTATCGSCTAPFECDNNVCVCTPDNSGNDCDEFGAECGTVSYQDECGNPNTINCGTCPDEQRCSASLLCECRPETSSELCTAAGAECGSITVPDRCGNNRTVSCGMCILDLATCQGNECIGPL